MKKCLSMAVAAALIGCLWAAPALAWDEAKLKAQVQEIFDQAAQGFMKKDARMVTDTAAPQATIKYRDGRTMSMAQWSQGMTTELADWGETNTKFVVEKAWPKGKGQIGALYSESHQFTRLSDPGHKHAIAARFRAVLTKTPQGWRFLEFTELNIRQTRDGKPLAIQAAPRKPAKPAKPQG